MFSSVVYVTYLVQYVSLCYDLCINYVNVILCYIAFYVTVCNIMVVIKYDTYHYVVICSGATTCASPAGRRAASSI